MNQRTTHVERFLLRIKRSPWVASLIALGTIIIALSTFTDAARNLLGSIKTQSPIEARAELSRLSLMYSPATFLDKAKEGDLIAVKVFLVAGMDPNVTDNDGSTALGWAAEKGHVSVVQALLKGKADVNHSWGSGATALYGAAYRGKVDVLRVLIEAGADSKSINGAAHAAARKGRLDALRFLLDRKPQLAVSREDDGDTLLISAARSGDKGVVEMVAEKGVSVTDKGEHGLTALHVAADRGSEEVVRFLLHSGAAVNAKDDAGMLPLHFAADQYLASVVGTLLNAGADVNARCGCPDRYGGGATALMIASGAPHTEVAQILLERGADANVTSNEGWTALLVATASCTTGGGEDLVRLLLDKGADVNARVTATGVTALMRAQQRVPCIDTTRALLGKGADVNAKDKDSWTVAMYALKSGSVDAVRTLLKQGAHLQPDAAMPDGSTPLQWVESNLNKQEKSEMTRLLSQRIQNLR